MRWIWIDKFIAFESRVSATAIKNVSLAEEHVHDLYPGFPIHPNSLIVEGMAQTAGILVGQLLAFLFNRTGATWTPPGQAAPIPLEVLTSGVHGLLAGGWIGLVLMATVAAVIPANRAARLEVVDALRHV